MTLVALDITGDRITARGGPAGQAPRAVALDGDRAEMPLALSLEAKHPRPGRAGIALCRRSPHLACVDFLHRLGEPGEWRIGRHRLDVSQALTVVLAELPKRLSKPRGVVLVAPGYLTPVQMNLLAKLSQEAGLPVTGAVTRGLAAALASYAQHPWHNVGVVVDVDNHALLCTVLRPADLEMHVLGQWQFPMLGLRRWRERLLAFLADQCVRVSRRDLRDSPEAEQVVFDQLDHVLDTCQANEVVSIRIQARHWFQTVALQADEIRAACRPLAVPGADQIHAALVWAEQQMTSATIYLTTEAMRLPGLVAAVYHRCQNRVPVVVLPAEAPANAAHELACRIDRGELAPGLLDPAAPLPLVERAESPEVIPFPRMPTRAANDMN